MALHSINTPGTRYPIPAIVKLLIAIGICEITGILSAVISRPRMEGWFEALNKPSWNPPSWLFGPVWTVLYLMMGVALWLVWKKGDVRNLSAEKIFAAQLFLNFWWSVIFFRFHSPLAALVEIFVLWVFIVITVTKFSRISSTAGWLLVPYVAWVSFATALNFSIWMLN